MAMLTELITRSSARVIPIPLEVKSDWSSKTEFFSHCIVAGGMLCGTVHRRVIPNLLVTNSGRGAEFSGGRPVVTNTVAEI